MKRLPIILNAVLLVAVAALYVLYFTSHAGKSGHPSNTIGSADAFKGNLKIAFINIDSLMSKYGLFAENKIKLAEKQKKMEAELNDKTSQFQSHYMDFQNKINKGLVTTMEAQELQKNLSEEQQNLIKLRDQLNMELTEQEQVMNRQMINEIEKYLKDYTREHPYQYILSYSFGGNLLYASDSLEITQDVLKQLNEKFKETSKAKK